MSGSRTVRIRAPLSLPSPPACARAKIAAAGSRRRFSGAGRAASRAPRACAPKDRRRGLAPHFLGRGQGIGKRRQAAGTRLDVAADERRVLVERALAAVVFLEGELKLGARLDLLR